jgi:TetR/AcrR family transcriptional regulator
MPASDRKQQILETALDVFSRRGFEGTTTRELASAAGVAEAVIFRHFPTKQALYNAVLDYKMHSAEAQDRLAETRACMELNDDNALFRQLAGRVLASYRTDPRFERMILFAALEGHELALKYLRQQFFPFIQLLDEYVRRRQAEGALKHLRPMAILSALFGMAHHYAQVSQMMGFIPEEIPDDEIIDSFVRILLDGVRTVQCPEPNGSK